MMSLFRVDLRNRPGRLRSCLAAGAVVSVIACGQAQVSAFSQDTPRPAPADVIARWDALVGTWIADNSRYKSAGDPIDAYGIEWTWGLSEKSLIGRLFGLRDGKEIRSFWEFREIWHPAEQRLIIMQFGNDGTFGIGPSVPKPDGSMEALQTFYHPEAGTTTRGGHRAWLKGEVQTTTSYDVDEQGVWKERRTYEWRRQRDETPSTPRQAMSALEPFIGRWKADTPANATFVNYRLLEWDLSRTIVRFFEAPDPDGHWTVTSLIAWNPVEEEIQEQAHADWGNFVRVRYQKTDDGFERRMTVYNGTDRKVHHWISTWRLLDANTFQTQAKEYSADGELVQEWPVMTYRRIGEIPESVIRKRRDRI